MLLSLTLENFENKLTFGWRSILLSISSPVFFLTHCVSSKHLGIKVKILHVGYSESVALNDVSVVSSQ